MSFSDIMGTFQRELPSFRTPPKKDVSPVPQVGSKAPTSELLPLPRDKPTLILFLRHCGCPFAEKNFKLLTALSSSRPALHCIAVSHSSREATDRWIPQVGGEWEVEVLVDEGRDLYSLWGLGIASTWHVVNPVAAYSALDLGRREGIWNRPTESGSRWQTGGAFAVDAQGVVRWAHVASRADDVPDFEEAVRRLELPAPSSE